MVAVCHTENAEEPIFWVWLAEAAREVEVVNYHWKEQDTVTILSGGQILGVVEGTFPNKVTALKNSKRPRRVLDDYERRRRLTYMTRCLYLHNNGSLRGAN